MPRKKNVKKLEKNRGERPLSPIEEKLRSTSQENEMMEKVLKERKKRLAELEEVQARERLALGRSQDEMDNGEDSSAEGPRREFAGGPRRQMVGPRRMERESEEGLERQEEFERTLEQFTETQGMVDVYRLKDGNYAKMASIEAKDWGTGLETVAKRFGGGTFKVRLRAPDGTFAGETVVHYDEEAYPKPSEKITMQPQGVDQVAMLRAMNEMNERSNERMMSMMNGMMSTFASMNAGKSSMLNNMNDLMAFKEMLAEKKNPATELNTLVGVLQKGMELGANTSAPEESLLGSILGKVLNGDTISKLAQALSVPAAQAEVPQPPPAARQQLPAPRPQAPAKPKKEEGMSLFLKMYKPAILGYAKKKENPRKLAELIVSRIYAIKPDALLVVDDFLKLPDTKESIVYDYAPELRAYDAWVEKVMAQMSIVIAELAQGQKAKRAKNKAAKEAKETQGEPAETQQGASEAPPVEPQMP